MLGHYRVTASLPRHERRQLDGVEGAVEVVKGRGWSRIVARVTRALWSVLDGAKGHDTMRTALLWWHVPARQKEKGVALDAMVLLLCTGGRW